MVSCADLRKLKRPYLRLFLLKYEDTMSESLSGVVWCDMGWCDVTWDGVVWCDIERCGGVCHKVVWWDVT